MTKKDYLKLILRILEDDLEDLSEFSVENDDCFNEEVAKIKEIISEIKIKEVK